LRYLRSRFLPGTIRWMDIPLDSQGRRGVQPADEADCDRRARAAELHRSCPLRSDGQKLGGRDIISAPPRGPSAGRQG
jgi:hypothetical protein